MFGCGAEPAPPVARWDVVVESERAALLSVSGTRADDVWMVGADAGDGPLVLHWDGADWLRTPASGSGDLWWVQALPQGTVYLAGSGATLLRYQAGVLQRMDTPALQDPIVFGVWAAAPDDLYAVGSGPAAGGFLWHSDGGAWAALPLPAELPLGDGSERPALFKVWGPSAADVWVVGDLGVVLRGNARDGFRRVESDTDERLFTVHGGNGRAIMVGGTANGLALEAAVGGGSAQDHLEPVTPPGSSPLQGVCVSETGAVWAVGVGGNVYARDSGSLLWRDVLTQIPVQSLHAVWVDPEGGVWAVGGNVLTPELDHGVALHYGNPGDVAALALER
jgi:hypothetical protein